MSGSGSEALMCPCSLSLSLMQPSPSQPHHLGHASDEELVVGRRARNLPGDNAKNASLSTLLPSCLPCPPACPALPLALLTRCSLVGLVGCWPPLGSEAVPSALSVSVSVNLLPNRRPLLSVVALCFVPGGFRVQGARQVHWRWFAGYHTAHHKGRGSQGSQVTQHPGQRQGTQGDVVFWRLATRLRPGCSVLQCWR